MESRPRSTCACWPPCCHTSPDGSASAGSSWDPRSRTASAWPRQNGVAMEVGARKVAAALHLWNRCRLPATAGLPRRDRARRLPRIGPSGAGPNASPSIRGSQAFPTTSRRAPSVLSTWGAPRELHLRTSRPRAGLASHRAGRRFRVRQDEVRPAPRRGHLAVGQDRLRRQPRPAGGLHYADQHRFPARRHASALQADPLRRGDRRGRSRRRRGRDPRQLQPRIRR